MFSGLTSSGGGILADFGGEEGRGEGAMRKEGPDQDTASKLWSFRPTKTRFDVGLAGVS